MADPAGPVFQGAGDPDAWDRPIRERGWIDFEKREGSGYAFSHTNSHRPWRDWTSCVARSRDLIPWEKFTGNPILDHNGSSPILVDGPGGPHLFTMHPEVRRFSNPKP